MTKDKQLLFKLIELTTDKKISWEIAPDSSHVPYPDSRLTGKMFVSSYNGARLRLVRFKPRTSYVEGINLEILGEQGEVIYTISRESITVDLYHLISYKVEGVEKVFNNILGEGPAFLLDD